MAAVKTPIRVDICSDVVCPWCYSGKRRLELALVELDGEVELGDRLAGEQQTGEQQTGEQPTVDNA